MRLVPNLADGPFAAQVLRAYREVAQAVGTPGMHEQLDAVVQRVAPMRRWYFYRHENGPGNAQPRALAFRHEPDVKGMVDAYLERFRFSDPLNKVLKDARDQPFLLGLQPGDIPDALYRDRYMRDAQIAERLSLVHFDAKGCCVTSLARAEGEGELGQEAITTFQALSRLIFPLLEVHDGLRRERGGPCVNIEAIRTVLKTRCPSLTDREAEVCARMAIGVPAKSIANDLAISVETVQTYRKRAFQRLAITRGRQLAQLLT